MMIEDQIGEYVKQVGGGVEKPKKKDKLKDHKIDDDDKYNEILDLVDERYKIKLDKLKPKKIEFGELTAYIREELGLRPVD